MRKLNLGSGSTGLKGYINIEKNPRCTKVDIRRDIRKGLPFDDSSADEVLASHIVEHLTVEELMDLLEECYRVLKPDAELRIIVPLLEFATLDHKLFPSSGSFDCLTHDAPTYFDRNFSWEMVSKVIEPKHTTRPQWPQVSYEIMTVVFRAKKSGAVSEPNPKRKINLGCGPYKVEGAINIDRNPRWSPDVVRDVRRGLPFDDGSVALVNASHFFEHLTCDEMLFVMDECWRVLVPRGRMTIRVPIMEFTSRDHLQIIAEDGMDQFVRPDAGTHFERSFVWALISKNVSGKNLNLEWEAVK